MLYEELGCQPAALMVLHTWNQRLDHHPHLHALVPGGGPSQDGQHWVRSRHRHHQGRDKPYLVDNRLLSDRFRDKFLAGLIRLHQDSKLKLTDEWSDLQDRDAFGDWLQPLSDCDWVVFIEPPPTEHANPTQVLKYLARYLTGGPISDGRLIEHRDGKVTFWDLRRGCFGLCKPLRESSRHVWVDGLRVSPFPLAVNRRHRNRRRIVPRCVLAAVRPICLSFLVPLRHGPMTAKAKAKVQGPNTSIGKS